MVNVTRFHPFTKNNKKELVEVEIEIVEVRVVCVAVPGVEIM